MSSAETPNDSSAPAPQGAYRVLARKYRPANFGDLIGQDAMVRTISNAFEAARIPQAWILTGVRGVGKTTTARILARGLNYELPDGSVTAPTAPCASPHHGPHRPREVGEGRTARQPGQVRKEAALTSQGGSLSNLPLTRLGSGLPVLKFAFAQGKDGADMVAVNVNCLDGVDPRALTSKRVDGRSF